MRSSQPRDRALAAEAPTTDSVYAFVYSPDIDPTGKQFESVPKFASHSGSAAPAKTKTMVENHLDHACRRDGAGRARLFSARTWPIARAKKISAKVKGKGGVFKAMEGLQRRYGSARVFNTPIAEAGIVGRALGMAVSRPLAGGGDPVFRLYLAGYDAVSQRTLNFSRWRSAGHFRAPGRCARCDWRLSHGRSHLSQPVRRSDIYAYSGLARGDAFERPRPLRLYCARQ